MAKVVSPHIFRIISRIFLVLLLLVLFFIVFLLPNIKVFDSTEKVQGGSITDEDREYLNGEIEKTLDIVSARPDYSQAWLRLSVLYERVGDMDSSKRALDESKRLNPDL
ncbi:MAG: hypothetical protein NUV69_03290 [Candidatus Curtissbacteria bacterium]|nr:hypothetical protein [Candidatus Curtissbacteria bacterium]